MGRACFDADNYGALLVVDAEAELGQQEKAKLEADVKLRGLSLIVFSDWYDEDFLSQVWPTTVQYFVGDSVCSKKGFRTAWLAAAAAAAAGFNQRLVTPCSGWVAGLA